MRLPVFADRAEAARGEGQTVAGGRERSGQEILLSTGIDVGTTSTHLCISRLHLANGALVNQAPRLLIRQREIVHRGHIHLTPLTGERLIDARGVAAIVLEEYARAGVTAADIDTGAAIITGETARLRNAGAVIQALAELAGDFVAASAGPHLESILAARGSGAVEASRLRQCTVCNVDVGGGTTNIAVFSRGELIDTACLGIGGRFLQLTAEGRLRSLTESGELFLDAVAKLIKPGEEIPSEQRQHLGDLLAEAIVQYLIAVRPPQVSQRLLITEPLRRDYSIDEFWFSGGVAEFMQSAPADPLNFGDMGAYLAAGLIEALARRGARYHVPPMPIRATVIGAGSYSLQLSGSTVAADDQSLPLRNLQMIRPFTQMPQDSDLSVSIGERLKTCLNFHDLDWTVAPLAIVLDQLPAVDYSALERWAAGLAAAFLSLNGQAPLVVIAAQDIAMALGQLMRRHLPGRQVIVLDGIACAEGDFIDIGRSLANGQALPVVVKNLVFSV